MKPLKEHIMKLKHFFLAAALVGAAGLSRADPPPITLLPTGPGVFSAEFLQPVDGLFIDVFSFLPETFDGQVSVTLSSVTGPVSFFTASLNDQNFSFFPEAGLIDFSFGALVTGDVPLTLTVFGAVLDAEGNPNGPGSYRGTVTAVAAIPEPETYGLMLAGLAFLGARARRR
ncbi:MAG: FxDxF family PEP-CTERM protein [Proteobacteria bacterium]|nr:FxDxF family PEP-CTERM protein [Burkholderiales bacterium]